MTNRLTFSPKAQFTPTKSIPAQGPASAIKRPEDLEQFATWLKTSLHCQLLVRANFPVERSLPPSYEDFFEESGVPQVSVPFLDGTPPPIEIVGKTLNQVIEILNLLSMDQNVKDTVKEEGAAVLVHCKGGFGRSMCLLGALAVSLIPGLRSSAYFGWSRLVRPGSIQTAVQERFLRSLDEQSGDCCCVVT